MTRLGLDFISLAPRGHSERLAPGGGPDSLSLPSHGPGAACQSHGHHPARPAPGAVTGRVLGSGLWGQGRMWPAPRGSLQSHTSRCVTSPWTPLRPALLVTHGCLAPGHPGSWQEAAVRLSRSHGSGVRDAQPGGTGAAGRDQAQRPAWGQHRRWVDLPWPVRARTLPALGPLFLLATMKKEVT